MSKQIDALKLALEVLRMPCSYWNKTQFIKVQEAIKACEEALANHIPDAENMVAQPEQICGFDVVLDESMPPDTFKLAQPAIASEREPMAGRAVYEDGDVFERIAAMKKAPQRTWVGLRDAQKIAIVRDCSHLDTLHLIELVETELMENNK